MRNIHQAVPAIWYNRDWSIIIKFFLKSVHYRYFFENIGNKDIYQNPIHQCCT